MSDERKRWLVIFDPSGAVMGVSDGAPSSLLGRHVDDMPEGFTAIGSSARLLLPIVQQHGGFASTPLSIDPDTVAEVAVLSCISVARRRCDLAALVERAVGPFRLQAEARDVALVVSLGDAGILLDVDDAKIVWVIATLIGNGLRFVRPGTRNRPGGTVALRIRRDPSGPRAVIEVQDDGPGIELSRLRQLFAGEDSSAVALRLARDVARAHGGDLEVESTTELRESGTTVRLTLPAL
jgi:signal transduction histidine kinase